MIVKASPDHILYVCQHLREDDRREILLSRWNDDLSELAESFCIAPGSRFAVLREGIPVCAFGVAPALPGVGQAWLIGTDEIGSCGVEVAHACKTVVRTLLDGYMHRIQAYSAGFHAQAHRWLELLGFSRESRMCRFGKDGTDFFCYVICKPYS